MTQTASAEREKLATASLNTVEAGFEPLAEEFRRLMARGPRGGALVAPRGRPSPRRPAHRLGGPRRAPAPGAPRPRPSASPSTKGLASMVIHRLADRGLIDYDVPVATLLARVRRGRQGADHRPRAAQPPGRPLRRPGRRAQRRRAARPHRHGAAARRRRPRGPARPPAYHAITYGWLASGLARAVTGKGMRELVRTELAEPLGTTGLEIGTGDGPTKPAEMVGALAPHLHRLRHRGHPPARLAAGHQGRLPRPACPGLRAALPRSRIRPIWRTEMPAVNGALSADGLARLYVPLANGGLDRRRRALSLTRDRRAPRQGPDPGRRPRPRGPHALAARLPPCLRSRRRPRPARSATIGFGGSGGWGDPDTGISFGFVSSHIGNFTTAIGDLGILRLSGVARACAARVLSNSTPSPAGPRSDTPRACFEALATTRSWE